MKRNSKLKASNRDQSGLKFLKKLGLHMLCLFLFAHIMALFITGNNIVYADSDSSSSSSDAGKSLYEVLTNIYGSSSSSSSSTSSTSTSCVTVEQLMNGMETEAIGPTIEEIGLSESYHENYKIFEEQLNEDCSVFTNLANGSVTNRPVVVDVPDGVDATLKKDGNRVDFESRTPITEQGSYVLTIYVLGEDEEDKPFSEQVIQRGKYRFRIQYETGIEGYEAIDNNGYFADETEEGLLDGEAMPEEELPEEMMPDDFSYEEVSENEVSEPEEPEETTTTIAKANETFLAVNGMSGEYDSQSGFYKNTLLTGDYFYSNVPNGMLTNDAVMLQLADNLTSTVYKDGEVFEGYESGNYIQEAGSYTVYITSDSTEFQNAYGAKSPLFRFRIFSGPVSDAGSFGAPEGMTFTSVRFNGMDRPESIIRDDVLRLYEDGVYEVTMSSGNGSFEVNIALDTLPPLFNVQVEPNVANITYLTNDVVRCTLYKGDKLISDPDIVNVVEGSGNYTLTAYDNANNTSTMTFKVRYRVNVAAVFAILFVLALIAGAVIYLIRIRKKVAVR
ncbi:MAG: hypothetical protein K6F99_02585 [Lachnospiraceae bacterium]|nr:hypothetical protein [Lachnospiraceae bacterium]